MPHHRSDVSASAMAHGPVKAQDIESTRRDLERAQRLAVAELRAAAARAQRELTRRHRRLAGVA